MKNAEFELERAVAAARGIPAICAADKPSQDMVQRFARLSSLVIFWQRCRGSASTQPRGSAIPNK